MFQALSSVLCMICPMTGMHGNQVRQCCVNYQNVKHCRMGKNSGSFMFFQPGERLLTRLHHVATALCFMPSRPAQEKHCLLKAV